MTIFTQINDQNAPIYKISSTNFNFPEILTLTAHEFCNEKILVKHFFSGLQDRLSRTNDIHIDLHSSRSSPYKKNFEKAIVLRKSLQPKVRNIYETYKEKNK